MGSSRVKQHEEDKTYYGPTDSNLGTRKVCRPHLQRSGPWKAPSRAERGDEGIQPQNFQPLASLPLLQVLPHPRDIGRNQRRVYRLWDMMVFPHGRMMVWISSIQMRLFVHLEEPRTERCVFDLLVQTLFVLTPKFRLHTTT